MKCVWYISAITDKKVNQIRKRTSVATAIDRVICLSVIRHDKNIILQQCWPNCSNSWEMRWRTNWKCDESYSLRALFNFHLCCSWGREEYRLKTFCSVNIIVVSSNNFMHSAPITIQFFTSSRQFHSWNGVLM